MAKLIGEGEYKLLETKGEIKILILGESTFAWVDLEGTGEMLVTSQRPDEADTALSLGEYKLYEATKEPDASGQQRLELAVGEDAWQGYLLPTGLPAGKKVRSRIIAVRETITPRKTG